MVALCRYKLYNLCSERTYETHHFHDRVERVMIDDHNVPSLQQMLEFANKVPDDGTENMMYQFVQGYWKTVCINSRSMFSVLGCPCFLAIKKINRFANGLASTRTM